MVGVTCILYYLPPSVRKSSGTARSRASSQRSSQSSHHSSLHNDIDNSSYQSIHGENEQGSFGGGSGTAEFVDKDNWKNVNSADYEIYYKRRRSTYTNELAKCDELTDFNNYKEQGCAPCAAEEALSPSSTTSYSTTSKSYNQNCLDCVVRIHENCVCVRCSQCICSRQANTRLKHTREINKTCGGGSHKYCGKFNNCSHAKKCHCDKNLGYHRYNTCGNELLHEIDSSCGELINFEQMRAFNQQQGVDDSENLPIQELLELRNFSEFQSRGQIDPFPYTRTCACGHFDTNTLKQVIPFNQIAVNSGSTGASENQNVGFGGGEHQPPTKLPLTTPIPSPSTLLLLSELIEVEIERTNNINNSSSLNSKSALYVKAKDIHVKGPVYDV